MKKALLTVMLMLMVMVPLAMAAERKPLRQVSIDEMTVDTQPMVSNVAIDHMVILWWVPIEYWEIMFAQDHTITEAEKREILGVLRNVSLLGVVEADISSFGVFNFYSKLKVKDRMMISYRNANGKRQRLLPMKNIDPDLDMILRTITPMLSSAMGELGENFHFFVLDDRSGHGSRIVDPYKSGELTIQLLGEDNKIMTGTCEMPFDSLYVPRKCSNGRNARISWKYCPWSGEKLEE